MTRRTALIVGAGIGGLAAGVALRRAGWRVRIFERAAEARALGFALSLAPNAIEALRELGLAERLMAEGCVVGQVEIRRADGSVLKRFDVAAELAQAASVFALRRALHGALLDATEPETLSLGSEAAAFEFTDAGVVLTFQDRRSETGDVLIGADGVGSAIRTCWRGGSIHIVPFVSVLRHPFRRSISSSVFGQSCRSRRDSARSDSRRPSVWHFAQ